MCEKKPRFALEVVFDFDGYVDYYRGHGHAFISEDVLACVPFGFHVSYRETVRDIIEAVLDDINSRIEPIEFLNEAENDKDMQEQIREFLSDQNILAAIKETIGNIDDNEPFFDVCSEDLDEAEDDCECLDSPMLIGYIHVWKAEQ